MCMIRSLLIVIMIVFMDHQSLRSNNIPISSYTGACCTQPQMVSFASMSDIGE